MALNRETSRSFSIQSLDHSRSSFSHPSALGDGVTLTHRSDTCSQTSFQFSLFLNIKLCPLVSWLNKRELFESHISKSRLANYSFSPSPPRLSLCLSVYLYSWSCACVRVHIHPVDARGQHGLPSSLHLRFWDQYLFLNQELTDSTSLADQWGSWILLSLPPSTGIIGIQHHTRLFLFHVGDKDPTQVSSLYCKDFIGWSISPVGKWFFSLILSKPPLFCYTSFLKQN